MTNRDVNYMLGLWPIQATTELAAMVFLPYTCTWSWWRNLGG
ncbi:hypothetical protein TPY_1977 [Sulfobacillus acidophilus TPY]|nr:hypothetical protein TPY_1977 [Sulfobacillus acidophilus TPY]